jgi:chemotaxis protein MotB
MEIPNARTALLLLTVSCFIGGCVSKSVYEQKEQEALRLNQAFNNLEDENRELLKQKKDLVLQNEKLALNFQELSERNSELRRNLLQLRKELEYQRQVLTEKNMQAEKTIEQVRAETDLLEQQIEKERIAREARLAEIKSTYDTLVKTMEEEIRSGEVQISRLKGKLTVNLVEKILFESGSADIKPQGLEVLQRVGKILKSVEGKKILVEGHTDNVPISSRLRETFPSNWELATARAVNVVHFLQDKAGIRGDKLSACGYSQYQPVGDNRTAQGRAQNRRIQIVLVPEDSQAVEPQP